jgi:hypothetical protein
MRNEKSDREKLEDSGGKRQRTEKIIWSQGTNGIREGICKGKLEIKIMGRPSKRPPHRGNPESLSA